MTVVETWIGILLTGVILPAGSVATDPWVLLSVAVACVLVPNRSAYLFAAIVGTFVFAVTHSALYTSGMLEPLQLATWIIAPALAALAIAFVVRSILRLFKNQGAGA